ncbi:MAG TPA: YcaO-like family protein, partial [Kofleriaceae bacterium]|nr:YcaO-like family protein [Kofleriaceae bacterium]
GARPAAAAVFAQVTTDDLRDDVRALVARAAARGRETIVLDQTRPDLGLSAVKVVVPGLRHFWPRLAPGRLYDVPVALGRLAAPLSEDRLNPVPLYL